MAGESLADRTRVRSLRAGVLTIEVATAPLLHELGAYARETLLAELLEKLPGIPITDLRFRLGVFESGHG